ncbi:MAG TPA: sigma-70 family RNA polymerase sigma factor [Streptosporangiaceae bacterium]|nr:sigma-70 family RNA polymerase sigma factor [Streptosporangiaceae bacterium]
MNGDPAPGPDGRARRPDAGAPGPDAGAGLDVGAAVADAHRREWAFVLAATARVSRDIDVAEECVQDAYVAALDAWSRQGVPRNPGAWLTTTARRRALDAQRRDRTLRAKLPLLIEPGTPGGSGGGDALGYPANGGAAARWPVADGDTEPIADDRLRLVFTCCHPALAREAQVALTLRLVCGLTTSEIAQAFLVQEPTMAARVTRAKKKIAAARIPYRVPGPAELPDRLDAVLTVVHLLYTAGHTSSAGPSLVRADLVERAFGLARMLRELMPDEREVRGLLALLLLTDARRKARAAPDGRLLLLEEQDRRLWDRYAIDEGSALVTGALRGSAGRPGRFGLQAAIAAVHAEAPSYGETDWRQVLGLYDELMRAWPTPVVALNRAVAHAMVAGPAAGLADIEDIERGGRLAGYRYLPAAKADLLRRLGRTQDAASAYRAALALSGNEAERSFLAGRISEVSAGHGGRG